MYTDIYYIVERSQVKNYSKMKNLFDEYLLDHDFIADEAQYQTGNFVTHCCEPEFVSSLENKEEVCQRLVNLGLKARVIQKNRVVINFPEKEKNRLIKNRYQKLKDDYFKKIPDNIGQALEELSNRKIKEGNVLFVICYPGEANPEFVSWPLSLPADYCQNQFYLLSVQKCHCN